MIASSRRNWTASLASALCALAWSAPGRSAAQGPCVAAATLKQLNALVADAETVVESRLQNSIALAAVRLLAVNLSDGRIVVLPPAADSPESIKLAKSIEKLAKKEGVACSATTMGNCAEPFAARTDQQAMQLDGDLGIFDELNTRVRGIRGLPDFQSCVSLGDKRTLAVADLGARISETRLRFEATNALLRTVDRTANRVLVQCAKPDVLACTAQLPPDPPLEPNRAAARRKLKNPPKAPSAPAE